MRRYVAILAPLAAVVAIAGAAWQLHRGPDARATAANQLIDRYCTDCHNPLDFSGSLSLKDRDVHDVATDAAVWEHVVRKLKTGMMPPAGEPRPERVELDSLAAELEGRLDRAGADHPQAAPDVLRRLNRTEYANAIRDLLSLDVDASTLLPLDDSSEGFDNNANALGTSPALIEAYVSAAMKISRLALGDRSAQRTQVSYPISDRLRQDRRIEGLPLGTRGGIRIEHQFPLDAEYEFHVGRGFGGGGRIDFTIDDVPINVGTDPTFRVAVSAGPHWLGLALVDTRRTFGVDDIYAAPKPTNGIQSLDIDGPLDATGVGDTPSRRRILTCVPESAAAESECARTILSDLAQHAFRRPLDDGEVAPLMAFYESARASGDFESGIQEGLARILVDPRFLYRVERDSDEVAPGTAHEIDDYELATRLSFFLWSSIPDDALLDMAATGRLHEPAALAGEVRRMLADPKSEALVENFAAQWLFLRELDSVTPDDDAFDENLRLAMARETKLLFATVLNEDLSVLRLLDADFTFVNERLAEHYQMPGVRGSHFRRVEIPADSPRRGLLGQASILTVTSVTNRTSPVIRGRWILETLLGSPAPTPPPNVETTLEGDNGELVDLSVRERLEAHRANPVCASCHAIMDPIGFTLENFDLVGHWRDIDSGQPIDTSATLVDGTPIDGPATLRQALLDRSDAFVTRVTEKLWTYAFGRRVEYYDMPTIRAIVREAADEDNRLTALIQGIVQSEAFRTRVKGDVE